MFTHRAAIIFRRIFLYIIGCLSIEFSDLFSGITQSKIIEAIQHDNIQEMERLIKDQAVVKALKENPLKLFETICEHGATHMIGFLNHSDLLDIFLTDSVGRTLLHKAIDYPQAQELCAEIIGHFGLIDAQDVHGMTPLYDACKKEKFEVCTFLLKKGAQTTLKTTLKEKTFLHLLAQQVNCPRNLLNEMMLCIARSKLLELRDKKGNTALHTAVNNNNKLFVEAFCSYGGNREAKNQLGKKALDLAVELVNPEMCQVLRIAGARLDEVSHTGNTLLHTIASLHCPQQFFSKKWYGRATNQEHWFGAQKELVKLIKHWGIKIFAKNRIGETALHVAARNGNIDLCSLFLDEGVYFDSCSMTHNSPLYVAADAQQYAVCILLLENRAAIDLKNIDGETFLHLVAKKDTWPNTWLTEVFKVCSLRKCSLNCTDGSGDTPLHTAVRSNNREFIKQFLSYKGDIYAKNSAGETALHLAVRFVNRAIVELLIVQDDYLEIRTTERNTLLHLAAAVPSDQLLYPKEKVSDDSDEEIPSSELWKARQLEIAKLLFSRGMRSNGQNNDGETPLHLASKSRNIEMMKLLIENDADINAVARQGKTPLMLGSESGHTDVCLLLLKCSSINKNCKETEKGFTALFYACFSGKLDVCKLLLQYGCDAQSTDFLLRTPLHIACLSNNSQVTRELLRHQNDVNAQDREGDTPLHYACNHTTLEHAKVLLTQDSGKKIDVHVKNRAGKTALSCAIERNSTELTNLLLCYEADVEEQHIVSAAQQGSLALCELLKKNSSPVVIQGLIKKLVPLLKGNKKLIEVFEVSNQQIEEISLPAIAIFDGVPPLIRENHKNY